MARIGNRERGSVVTWAVVGLMLISLLVYLVVAYVSDEAGESPSGASPSADQAPHEDH